MNETDVSPVERPRNSRIKNSRPMIGPGSGHVEEPLEPPPATSPSGAMHVPKIDRFIDEQIRFFYHDCPIKMLAVPTMVGSLLVHYAQLEREMIETRKRMGQTLRPQDFKIKPDEEHWGGYTLDHWMFNTPLSSVISYRVVVVPQLARVGAVYAGTLIDIAKKFVMKESVGSFVSDIRHLMYIDESSDGVPDVLKNGQWNVFAGTTVMIGSVPHVMAARWYNNQFEKKFLSLFATLTEDIQFVMIRK